MSKKKGRKAFGKVAYKNKDGKGEGKKKKQMKKK